MSEAPQEPFAQEPGMFTLDELATLTDLPRRTVRYYIQIGLLEKPLGSGRGAHYGQKHLEQLLEIRKWQQAGLSLDRIRDLLDSDAAPVPPPRPRGAIEVWSHLLIDEGLELMIDPKRTGLSPEQVRQLTQALLDHYQTLKSE